MFELRDRIVFVTGASSGIGLACAEQFARHGAHVLLAARRQDRVRALVERLVREHGVRAHALELDVRDRAAVEEALGSLPGDWQEIEILVNNAGLSRGLSPLHEGEVQDWEEMIDTNVKGLLYVTRTVLPGMVERGRGHVVQIGSIAGHEVYPGGNVYCATKSAVEALNRALRIDLLGTPIRVSSVDPGMVETEFSLVRFHGDAARAATVYDGLQPLTAEDVADAVLWCVTRPAHVNVQDMVLMPTAQACATMAHREKR